MPKRIGLLGGSFDPIHQTHLRIALAAKDILSLDKVAFIPVAQSWQKGQHHATADQRLTMAQLACQPFPDIEVWDIEIKRGPPSYTIDTLNELSHNRVVYYWLMGSDQLNNFCSWKQWQDLIKLIELCVVSRAGEAVTPPAALLEALKELNRSISYISMPESAVSSTKIRQALKQGNTEIHDIPTNVLQYILENKLYSA